MRRRVRVNLPTSTPDDEVGKPPQPENRRVIHRYRVPAHEVHGRGGESTATQKLTRIVGKPPEIIEPEDAETLSKLEYAYKKYEDDPNDTAKGRYYLALPLVSGSKPSETTIQAFINQKLPEHKDEEKFKFKAGVFLSAVIQTSPDKRITLDVTKLPTLEFLCLRLENKEVTIIGDVGEDTAVCAKSGSVTVKETQETQLEQISKVLL